MNAQAEELTNCEAPECMMVKTGTQRYLGDLRIAIMRSSSDECRLSIAPTDDDDRPIVFMARSGDRITIGDTRFQVTHVSDDGAEFQLADN